MPFPDLPSGNNPSLAALSGLASGAASLSNALTSAANQEAARVATKKAQDTADYQRGQQQDLTNQIELLKNNFVPAQTYAGGYDPPPSRPTLMTPEDNPAAQGDGPTITDRNGQVWKQKTKDQLASEDPRNFVPSGQLADALKLSGRDVTKPISPTDSHDILQSLNSAQEAMKGESYHIDTSGKFQDASGKPTPVMIGDKTGKVRLLDFGGTNLGDPGASGQFAPPEKTPPAAKVLHFEKDTNDKGDVVTRGYDPETGELKSTNVAKGIGGTRKDPNATPIVKPKVMTPATARTIRKSRDVGLKQANSAYDVEMKAASRNADGSVSTADTIAGGPSPFEKRRLAYAAVQNKFEQDISEATGNDIPHNDWADRMQEFPANGTASKSTKTAQPAQPAQPTAAPAAPPAAVTNGLAAGTHTFGNGQVWKKGADGSMAYVSGGQ